MSGRQVKKQLSTEIMSKDFESNSFVSLICCKCSVSFEITETLHSLRINDGQPFYCPNGHSQFFSESLQEQLDEVKKKLFSAESRVAYLEEQIEAINSKEEGKGIFDFLLRK